MVMHKVWKIGLHVKIQIMLILTFKGIKINQIMCSKAASVYLMLCTIVQIITCIYNYSQVKRRYISQFS